MAEQASRIGSKGSVLYFILPVATALNVATVKDTASDSVTGAGIGPDPAFRLRESASLEIGSAVLPDVTMGAYPRHFKLVPKDWRDRDISSAPKDENLYGFDLYTNTLLYRVPVTNIERNVDASLEFGKPVHFCPCIAGCTEWSGTTYAQFISPALVDTVDWWSTLTLLIDAYIPKSLQGKPSYGAATIGRYGTFDAAESFQQRAG